MPDIIDRTKRGILHFDGTCPMCCRSVRMVAPILAKRGVGVRPFEKGADEPEMRLTWHDGRAFGGADAAIFLAGRIWWAWPLSAFAHLPGVHGLASAFYRRIAARRHCGGGACALRVSTPVRPLALGWSITVGLTAAALMAGAGLPAWVWMWLLAAAMWLGFKIIAWTREPGGPSLLFFAWVGMDARAFARHRTGNKATGLRGGLTGMLIGLVLLLAVAPRVGEATLAGWVGMAGLIAALHFGLFDLAAAGWQRLGFPVQPIMRSPWKAVSLADFWGARWNRAFSDVARIALFRPLVRRFGAASGTLAGFLLSGLAHELVISVPARAGYGLPTLYFLIQGLAVITERWLITPGSLAARIFLWLAILAPAGWLFHHAFLENVIHPMMLILTPR